MPLTAYFPLDQARYRRDNDSVPFSPDLPAGVYVFVQDCAGVVWVLPDGRHRHPRVLGGVRPAVAAGEVIVGANGEILSINNASGTFRCVGDSLLTAVGGLVNQGAIISVNPIKVYEV
jgi:hypothetical protein